MKFFRKYHRFIFVLVSPVMMWLFINSTLNRHSHIVGGSIISHAHPYEKEAGANGPVQSHRHSEDELILFDRVSNILVVLAAILYIPVLLNFIREIMTICRIVFPVITPLSLPLYRGPPSF